MQIKIRKTNGFIFTIAIADNSTILELKKIISQKLDEDVKSIKIVFKGYVVPDHFDLTTAEITEGTTVGIAITSKRRHMPFNFGTDEDFFIRKSVSTGNIRRHKAHPSKEQLLALDSRMHKFDLSSKASIQLSKRFVHYQSIIANKADQSEEETVIPEPADSPSTEPLPLLFFSEEFNSGINDEDIPPPAKKKTSCNYRAEIL